MVYASSSIALACLETVVHLGATLPFNRYLVRIEVPDDAWSSAIRLDPDARVGWDALPEGKVSLDAGEAWATSRHSVLLIVPSVIVPEEDNVLINPAHADTASIQARKMRRWTYDTRLLSRL